ncbi:MAG TPA: homocysteine S-methyltransferase family protein [Candidatus Krumholzibacteria bacterium]|nr:homocysteine S-methyltransferase family protein [Candidatus Krumholzibacteria bacterium]
MAGAFENLLATREVVFLDGAIGTELHRRGVPTQPPLWTADAATVAPDVLEKIHGDYLLAGADIVTANTFRSTPYTLRKVGRELDAQDLTQRTVGIARRACTQAGRGLVAGCMAPLEDCFHPERVPPGDVLLHEHTLHARHLQAAGVDLLLVETMNTAREAHDAALVALETGLPVLVSLILDPDGEGDLLSGEDLDVAWAHIRPLPVAGFLVNCTPPEVVTLALERMHWSGDKRPIGAYANFGHETPDGDWAPDTRTPPSEYGRIVATWRELGARLIGGCCGTTPEHLRAATTALR